MSNNFWSIASIDCMENTESRQLAYNVFAGYVLLDDFSWISCLT